MALVNAPAMPAKVVDTKDVPPPYVERDRWGRPLIPQPDGSTEPYARASSLGELVDDSPRALEVYKLRGVAWGTAHDAQVHADAAAIDALDDPTDKRAAYQVAKRAMTAAGYDVKAERGTLLHHKTEEVDRTGVLPDDEDHAALLAYQRVMRLFHVLHSEVFVVSDRFRSAGTADRIVMTLVELQPVDGDGNPIGPPLPAGTVIVLDLKTSETDRYFGVKFAVQVAVYQDGHIVVRGEDGADWHYLGPHGAHPKWAIILHMPQGGMTAELQWVDLDRGRRLAELAADVREARKIKGLITLATDLPFEPTHSYDPATGMCVELSDEFDARDAEAEQAEHDLAQAAAAVPPPCCGQFHPAGTTCPDPFLPEDRAAADPEVASMVNRWLGKSDSASADMMRAGRAAAEGIRQGVEATALTELADPVLAAAVKLGVPVSEVLDAATESEVESAVVDAIGAAARAHGDACDCFGCEDAEGERIAPTPPVPVAQATMVLRAIERGAERRVLLVKVMHAESEAAITELWRAHRGDDLWTEDHTRAATKRVAELAEAAAAAAVPA